MMLLMQKSISLDAIRLESLFTLLRITPLYCEKGEEEMKMDERKVERRSQTMKEMRIRSPTGKKPL